MVDRLVPDSSGKRLYSVLKVSAPGALTGPEALIFEVIDTAATIGQGPSGPRTPSLGL
jgi:hypothetical protein